MSETKASKKLSRKAFSDCISEIQAVLEGKKPLDAQTKAANRALQSHVRAKNKEIRDEAKRLGLAGKTSLNSMMKELLKN